MQNAICDKTKQLIELITRPEQYNFFRIWFTKYVFLQEYVEVPKTHARHIPLFIFKTGVSSDSLTYIITKQILAIQH